MSDFPMLAEGTCQQILPAKRAVGDNIPMRLDDYGNLLNSNIMVKKHGLTAEGSQFVTTNPTPGTGIAGAISATYGVTHPWMVLRNNGSTGGPTAYLDYLKFIVTVVPAGSTTFDLAVVRDVIAGGALTTDHMAYATPVNLNPLSTGSSKCTLGYLTGATANTIAALTPAAAVVGRGTIGGLTIAGDQLIADFGAMDPSPWPASTAAEGAAQPGCRATMFPPICCPPGYQLLFYYWGLTNSGTALSYEFEFSHFER